MREAKMDPSSQITQKMNNNNALAVERIRNGMLLSGEVIQLYTVDDARKKLEKEFEVFKDGDSRYLIKNLIECSETDHKLLQGIMQPDKSYDKAFQYFFQRSRRVGYKLPYGNLVFLDNDLAVRLAVEYFKGDVKPQSPTKNKRTVKPKVRAKVEAQIKPEARSAEKKPEKVSAAEIVKKKPDGVKKRGVDIDGQLSLFGLG